MSHPSTRYAVCERVLRQGSFASDVALVRAAGIGAIGLDDAAVDAVGPDEAARILDSEGVRVSSYMGLGSILSDDGVTAGLDDVIRRLDVAARLDARGALVGTGPLGGLRFDDAAAICTEWLVRAGAHATEREVRIMLEPMHPLMRRWSFVHTLRDALALVDRIEGAGVVLDLGHVWWERGLEELIHAHVTEIVSVQVTNVDARALEEVRYERAPLEHGDVPVAQLVAQLETAGYRGWYEDETLVRMPREERLGMLRSSRGWFAAL